MERILIAIDDCRSAPAVLDAGVALVNDAQATSLRIVHVIDPRHAAAPEGGASPEMMLADLRRCGAELIAAAERRIHDACDVSTTLIEGLPAREITDLARSWGADVIVVGADGRRWFTRLLQGSLAADISRRAPCSVLWVQPDRVQSDRTLSLPQARTV